MTTPPADPQQPPVPPQPLPPTPTTTDKPATTRKPRQRKRAAEDKQHLTETQQTQRELLFQCCSPHCSQRAAYSPRGPVFQPYPGQPYIMNPPYPVNGSPYPQHPQHPQQQMQGAAPAMGAPPQYAYPMHPNPYSHGYSPYPQYQPMMMYPPPRHSIPPEAQHHEHAVSVSAPVGKRKRKNEQGRKGQDRASDDETGASGSDAPRQTLSQKQSANQSALDLKKRTKTVSTSLLIHLFKILTVPYKILLATYL